MNSNTKKQIVSAAAEIIFGNEGNYTSVNANDNGALSVGKVQWHGNRALSLLKKIIEETGQTTATTILGSDLWKEIKEETDWSKRTVNADEKNRISKLLGTAAGKEVQDDQAESDITEYVDHGIKIGIEDPQSLVYFADLENQGGAGASARVGKTAAANAGGAARVTLAILHAAALADSVMGRYTTRRNKAYAAAAALFTTGTNNQTQTGGMSMNEKQVRQNVVSTARQYLGCKESDGSHKKIIDGYNAHKPLARGYAVKYTDPWCATFVSFVAIMLGYTDIIPTECGCEQQINLFKQKGRWQEDGTVKPEIADVIYYNWDDSTQPNDGYADHVGYVTEVSGNTIKVIEGNYSNAVKERTITVGTGNIRGYGKPDYAKKATSGGSSGSGSTSSGSSTSTSGGEQKYTVKAGDTLSTIAAKYGTTYQKLATYNGIADPNKIKVGQVIKIPGTGSTSSGSSTSTSGGEQKYTVKAGDTLSTIAAKYGTTYQKLATYNGIADPNKIKVGQVIKIPGTGSTSSGSSASTSGGEQTYTVKAGDTLSSIAAKYGTTYQKLATYNGIANPNNITVGQVIRIPGTGTRTYTVKSGDTLWGIADKQLGDGSRYNEIKTLNGLKSDVIHAGQTLKLPNA